VPVYLRSEDLVITERIIKIRYIAGWQVWVIDDLGDFRIVRHEGRRRGFRRRQTISQLWATRRGISVLVFESGNVREFDAMTRALRRVLENRDQGISHPYSWSGNASRSPNPPRHSPGYGEGFSAPTPTPANGELLDTYSAVQHIIRSNKRTAEENIQRARRTSGAAIWTFAASILVVLILLVIQGWLGANFLTAYVVLGIVGGGTLAFSLGLYAQSIHQKRRMDNLDDVLMALGSGSEIGGAS
jgi:hypothetical protein